MGHTGEKCSPWLHSDVCHIHFLLHTSSPHTPTSQARELKSVHVNVPGSMLRLVIHKAHVNKLNIYNQVWGSVGGCVGGFTRRT